MPFPTFEKSHLHILENHIRKLNERLDYYLIKTYEQKINF